MFLKDSFGIDKQELRCGKEGSDGAKQPISVIFAQITGIPRF